MYLSLSTLSFETGLSQNSELTDWLGCLARDLQGSPEIRLFLPPPPVLALQMYTTIPGFSVGTGDPGT